MAWLEWLSSSVPACVLGHASGALWSGTAEVTLAWPAASDGHRAFGWRVTENSISSAQGLPLRDAALVQAEKYSADLSLIPLDEYLMAR